ncbi:hypothetical protein [Frigoriglobus tundricola]|uniref:Uncharacterized protein n=1 Tax=Frigoriglobus tundricola TaxID=2774151 RepID=A0A6M5YWI7_9BACT|nr:hypothetical protein [Frigoriglobus tundricola]QJW98319.1 hypothetical protein FTUN_5907 [Frigoriglobus tundricola]
MKAVVHIGLSVAILLAPTLCCCKVRGLGTAAHAAPAPGQTTGQSGRSAPVHAPVESCCLKAKTSCCHESNDSPDPEQATAPKPAKPGTPVSCPCCGERPDAAQTESQPTVAAPELTGELFAFSVAALAAGSSEHTGRFHGLFPPERAGVDARSAALFERHVMHC